MNIAQQQVVSVLKENTELFSYSFSWIQKIKIEVNTPILSKNNKIMLQGVTPAQNSITDLFHDSLN